jgi:peptidoglycan hydrolase CwlO-like protein
MTTSRAIKMPKTETEIAVLQVQVQNIENDISEIKTDIKEVTSSIATNFF